MNIYAINGNTSFLNFLVCFYTSLICEKLACVLMLSYVQVEKRRLFQIFLKQFLTVFRDWKPFDLGTSPEEALTDVPTRNVADVVVGCNFGQPAEIILILIGEVTCLTKLLTDSKWITCYYYVDDVSEL